jgi:hypothetical protein
VAGVYRIGEANLEIIFADSIRWLSTGGVSSVGKARQMWLIAAAGHKKGGRGGKLREPPF